MSTDTSVYQHPWGRYISKEMSALFSPDKKFGTWRSLWIALAKAQQELGLDITDDQIAEMIEHRDDINYDVANKLEHEIRHDVMAHIKAYGKQCPQAEKMIHLGATSCYVTDNTDILLMREGMMLIKQKLLKVIDNLAKFAEQYKDLPTLGYTHFQPATPTTVGKRATLWLQGFVENVRMLDFVMENMKLLGCRGATGTSETMMKLFDGDEEAVKRLDCIIVDYIEEECWSDILSYAPPFEGVYPVSGQTYPRNLDIEIVNCLALITVSACKMAADVRLLQHDKELEEPFGEKQVGSSAMAYKRNPMRCERICSLSRIVQSRVMDAYNTASTQWLERTLDDSAGRRVYIPEAFFGTEAVLTLCANVTKGLVVYSEMIRKHLDAELPFMITEDIMMRCVKNGGNRQEIHEKIREYSMEAASNVKELGGENNLIELIMGDAAFNTVLSDEDARELMDAKRLIGRCVGQVDDYLRDEVRPLLECERQLLAMKFDAEVRV